MSWLHRLANTLRPRSLSRDLDRELAFHLAERADDLAASGMSIGEAALEARRRFGNRTMLTERTHDRDVMLWLESVLADVRYAARTLIAHPGFTAVAVLSLALGLGANTAIFSLADAVILRALPVRDPAQLMMVEPRDPKHPGPSPSADVDFTNPIWEQIRDHTHVFTGVFAYNSHTFDLSNGGLVRHANGAIVSGAFFDVLGVRAIAGRLLGTGDDVRGCGGVAVVSGGFASRELGGAAAAVGRTLSLDGHPMEIVGVSDPRFFGIEVGRKADVFIPLCTEDLLVGPGTLDQRSRWYLQIVGRAAPGLTLDAVSARLAAAAPGITEATLPQRWSHVQQAEYLGRSFGVRSAASGFSDLRQEYDKPLWLLMAAVVLVLIIACVNIANLLLARGAARQREIAIRVSLGAGRARVVRQLLTECVLLALAGAALGVLFARWADLLIVSWISTRRQPAALDLSFDWRVFGFTIGAALVTAVLFGLMPAWRATRVDAHALLKSGGRGLAGTRRHRMSRPLVAAQLALSLALVTSAGLLLTSFRNLASVDPGFRRDGIVLVEADLSRATPDTGRIPAMARGVLDGLRAIPGVRSVSQSAFTAMSGAGWNEYVLVPGFTAHDPEDSLSFFNQVSDDYFATMGTPLLAGRAFTPADGARSDAVVIVSRTMARRFFGVDNPLGRTFRTPVGDTASPPFRIIGVVGDSKYRSLDETSSAMVYLPLGSKAGLQGWAEWNYEVRTDLLAPSIVPAVRDAIGRVSPAIEIEAHALSSQVDATLARPRLLATLSSFFGALALVLAVVGLYGTLAYDVARRRNEIGIRMALGAAWRDVVRLIVGDAGRLVLAGVVIGAALSFAGTRFVGSLLYGVAPQDLRTLAGATLVLAGTALIATLVPAWRAVRTDPTEALREE
ncbi:MAG TPA: ABC transporter permease [Gemmatimonadaceae bacterium]|nr:ABC transporter permease [Gemmatimonadaceae bacterium]